MQTDNSQPIGIRGNTPMTTGDLEAHLALALRTENVGVLTGAGTSVSAGGPTMAGLWEALETSASETHSWLLDNGFMTSPDPPSKPPNLETAIDLLHIAEEDLRRRGELESPEAIEIGHHRDVVYKLLIDQCRLDTQLWTGEKDPATDALLSDHRTFVARLISTRSPGQDAPWIFTTNYDLTIEWSAESLGVEVINGFGGLHDRRFASSRFDLGFRNVQASGIARLGAYHLYLVKLHGSLTWLRDGPEKVREVAAPHAWRKVFAMEEPGPGALRDLVLILPNKQKYLASAGFLHAELVRRFTDFLGRPQTTLLVAGYSFNDSHINRVISSALNNPTLHLIVLLPELGSDVASRFNNLSAVAKDLVQPLVASSSPRVTFIHGDSAYFSSLVDLMPEPALLDDYRVQGTRVEQRLGNARPQLDENGGHDD